MSGKMYWMTLTQVHGCGIDKKTYCLQDEVRTTQPSLHKLVAIFPLSCFLPDKILEEFCWKPFCQIFLEILDCVFFKVKHSFGHISGMIGSIDVKQTRGTSIGYWVNYVTLTFDLTRDLDPWFLKVSFQNSCISGTGIWLMLNKKKAYQLDTGLTVWSCPLTTLVTLTL